MILHIILWIIIATALCGHYRKQYRLTEWAFWWRYLTWSFIIIAFASTEPIHFFS